MKLHIFSLFLTVVRIERWAKKKGVPGWLVQFHAKKRWVWVILSFLFFSFSFFSVRLCNLLMSWVWPRSWRGRSSSQEKFWHEEEEGAKKWTEGRRGPNTRFQEEQQLTSLHSYPRLIQLSSWITKEKRRRRRTLQLCFSLSLPFFSAILPPEAPCFFIPFASKGFVPLISLLQSDSSSSSSSSLYCKHVIY